MVITQEQLTGPLPPFEPPTCDDTGICGSFRQPIYQCALCGSWSTDPSDYLPVVVSNGSGHQCKDFGRCQRRQARRAGRAS
jgi:hypothetical protein